MKAHESQHVNEDSCIFLMRAGGTPIRLGNVDPNSTRLEAIGFFPHTMSTTDSSYCLSDGMITSPMKKFSGAPGSSRIH